MRASKSPLLAGMFVLAALSASCASCTDQPATPVTFTIANKLSWPIFAHDEFEQAGTVIQRDDNGTWVDLREAASCACEECGQVCGACTCLGEPTFARRIAPGATFDRVWPGEFREDDTDRCASGNVRCVGARRAVQPGHYRVKLCYASSLTGNLPGGKDRFAADFPTSALTCGVKEFDLPASGPVEVTTVEPPGCKITSDCAADQLCQQGRCSSGCLPSAVPALGGEWTVEIGGIDDRGFFKVETDPKTLARTYRGTGKLSSVRYSQGTTNVTLIRYDASQLDFTADFYYTLPAKRALPLVVGETLDVVLVEFPSGDRKLARGVTLRRGGALLLAADTGRGGPALASSLTAPFDLKTEGEPFACSSSDCGKRTHRRMTFLAGDKSATVEPGKSAVLSTGGSNYELVSAANYRDEAQGCTPQPITPFVILQTRDAQTP